MTRPSSRQVTDQNALRYHRQILLPGFDLDGQERLLGSHVLIIGVGGLGCACAQYLVASGIGRLTLVDDDQVELSNLQRQVLHQESDIGRSKCHSALDSLRALNSEVEIEAIPRRLSDHDLAAAVSDADLVIDCTDNLATREQINRTCVSQKRPLVSGAAIRFEGQISSFVPGEDAPCYACLSALFGEPQLSCVESGVLSPVVGIIGSMQALEAINLLVGHGDNLAGKLLTFDGRSMQWQSFSLSQNPQCTVCCARD